MAVKPLPSPGELWAKVLDSRYGSWKSLDEPRRSSRDSIWWQDLSIVCNSFEDRVGLNVRQNGK